MTTEYEKFYIWTRERIPSMEYEIKFKADEYLGKWWLKKEIYKPGSGGQLECHKIIDELWHTFERRSQ